MVNIYAEIGTKVPVTRDEYKELVELSRKEDKREFKKLFWDCYLRENEITMCATVYDEDGNKIEI